MIADGERYLCVWLPKISKVCRFVSKRGMLYARGSKASLASLSFLPNHCVSNIPCPMLPFQAYIVLGRPQKPCIDNKQKHSSFFPCCTLSEGMGNGASNFRNEGWRTIPDYQHQLPLLASSWWQNVSHQQANALCSREATSILMGHKKGRPWLTVPWGRAPEIVLGKKLTL